MNSDHQRLDYEHVTNVLTDWLLKRVKDAGAKGAVVGLSGGIDSSVTSVLCQKAFTSDVLGIIMPCNSDQQDAADARMLAEKFDINYITKDLSPVLDRFLLTLQEDQDKTRHPMAVANMKPRLRMVTLYYYAAVNNYLVIGTDNWSELKVGYFTKHGDGGIDLAPLGCLVKTEVRELASYLGIPGKIIEKKPSAGLWQGQSDEEELGISYEDLDRYILTGEAEQEIKEKVEQLASKNRHKLEPIPMPKRAQIISK